MKSSSMKSSSSSSSNVGGRLLLLLLVLRWILLDVPITLLFGSLVFCVVVHKLHDDYLHPQLQLMKFQEDRRRYTDTTYYHRVCGKDDFTATSADELTIPEDFDKNECVDHMLTHGASVYPNLLTNETAFDLREWIVQENHRRRDGDLWGVIENENRYTWGIDINAHPKLQTFWQEIHKHKQLRQALEGILGPDPAVIEFTAITSSYGAEDQYMHADILHNGSPVKYARSFCPSYSLFVPLQDTTYEMGATHVCPGTHLCSEAEDICTELGAFAVSGDGPNNNWPKGSGALVNQQTFHRGAGFTQEGAPDRVVLIATFAPRPNFRNGLETRQIGQGGSYSLLWNQWGHTFSDYVHAHKRMTEPQKTLRSLGLFKGNGWNYLTTLSMRMSNGDIAMRDDDLEELLEEGGLWFLPRSWQLDLDLDNENSDISNYHAFGIGVLKKVEQELKRLYILGLGLYVATIYVLVKLQQLVFGTNTNQQQSPPPPLPPPLKSCSLVMFWMFFRIATMNAAILGFAWFALNVVEESNWASSIRKRKLYRIPVTNLGDPGNGTIPYRDDILNSMHDYSSDYLASYTRLLDVAHPGNSYWRWIVESHASSYSVLTDENMRTYFCAMLIDEVTTDRRFLKQDEERFWTEVRDMDELAQVCHRDLTTANNPLLLHLIRSMDSLKSETKFGRFRMTAMQSKTIHDYLKRWETKLLETSWRKQDIPSTTQGFFSKRQDHFEKIGLQNTIFSRAQVEFATTRDNSFLPLRTRTIPELPSRTEPFYGAWLKEGDRVMGLFDCDFENDEWFPGTITAAIPNEAAYDIAYDDGDIGEEHYGECFRRIETN